MPETHKLVHTGTQWSQSKGADRDIDSYDELNEQGELIAKFEVTDSMSIYPPFSESKSFSKTKITPTESS